MVWCFYVADKRLLLKYSNKVKIKHLHLQVTVDNHTYLVLSFCFICCKKVVVYFRYPDPIKNWIITLITLSHISQLCTTILKNFITKLDSLGGCIYGAALVGSFYSGVSFTWVGCSKILDSLVVFVFCLSSRYKILPAFFENKLLFLTRHVTWSCH